MWRAYCPLFLSLFVIPLCTSLPLCVSLPWSVLVVVHCFLALCDTAARVLQEYCLSPDNPLLYTFVQGRVVLLMIAMQYTFLYHMFMLVAAFGSIHLRFLFWSGFPIRRSSFCFSSTAHPHSFRSDSWQVLLPLYHVHLLSFCFDAWYPLSHPSFTFALQIRAGDRLCCQCRWQVQESMRMMKRTEKQKDDENCEQELESKRMVSVVRFAPRVVKQLNRG